MVMLLVPLGMFRTLNIHSLRELLCQEFLLVQNNFLVGVFTFPEALGEAMVKFVEFYNYRHYH